MLAWRQWHAWEVDHGSFRSKESFSCDDPMRLVVLDGRGTRWGLPAESKPTVRRYDQILHRRRLDLGQIALGTVENRNQAYRKYKDELQTSAVAYYGKLNRTEPQISEAVVRYSAEQAAGLLAHLDFQPWDVLPGYRCFSLDGNHLQKTQKRLKETRGLCAAPLPGTIVGRFDHQTGLFDQAYVLEDARRKSRRYSNARCVTCLKTTLSLPTVTFASFRFC